MNKLSKKVIQQIKSERVTVRFLSVEPSVIYETSVKRTNVPTSIIKNLDLLFSGKHSNAELQEAFNINNDPENFIYEVDDEISSAMLPLYFKQIFEKGGIGND